MIVQQDSNKSSEEILADIRNHMTIHGITETKKMLGEHSIEELQQFYVYLSQHDGASVDIARLIRARGGEVPKSSPPCIICPVG